MAKQTQALQGVKSFLAYRVLGETADAVKLAYQTEHEASSSKDISTEPTKDGGVATIGMTEQEVSATSYLSDDLADYNRLKQAHNNDEIIELWDLMVAKADTEGKYPATYYQAYLSEITKTAPSDGAIEVEMTFVVTGGIGQDGQTALSEDVEKVIQFAFTEATVQAEA